MEASQTTIEWIAHAAHVVAGLCIFSTCVGIGMGIFIGVRLAARERP